uniref:Putative secreted protein n=1 Tax=Anopheles darlingi TaxID=43151 RepID=A0A2M4DJX9_ANODA
MFNAAFFVCARTLFVCVAREQMASIWWLSSRFFLRHSNPIRTRIPSVLGAERRASRRGSAMCVAVGRRRLMPPVAREL